MLLFCVDPLGAEFREPRQRAFRIAPLSLTLRSQYLALRRGKGAIYCEQCQDHVSFQKRHAELAVPWHSLTVSPLASVRPTRLERSNQAHISFYETCQGGVSASVQLTQSCQIDRAHTRECNEREIGRCKCKDKDVDLSEMRYNTSMTVC